MINELPLENLLENSIPVNLSHGELHICASDRNAFFRPSHGVTGKELQKMKYLIIDVTPDLQSDSNVTVRFYEQNERKMEWYVKLFPGVRAMAVMVLRDLDSHLAYPPLTPGTLKSSMTGPGMRLSDLTDIEIGFHATRQITGEFILHRVFFSDEMPVFPKAVFTTIDRLGQWKQKEWEGKTHSLPELKNYFSEEEKNTNNQTLPGRDEYGGDPSIHFDPSGFFRTEKKNGHWYLVDPAGNAFFSSGVFGVYPGEPGWILGAEDQFDFLPDPEGEYARAYVTAGSQDLFRRKFSGMFPDETRMFAPATANLIQVFGKNWYDRWARLTAARLRAWGINTLSMFSDPDFIRFSGMPYVIMLEHFPVTGRTIFREFPDVFSDEYDEICRRFASQLKAYASDPKMIGYFLNNEPTWGFVERVSLGEKVLENGQGTASMKALISWLEERYRGNVSLLNQAWRLSLNGFEDLQKGLYRAAALSEQAEKDLMDFTRIMLDRYAGIPSEYARQFAPHHLNLGMRFAGGITKNPSLLVCAKYFDVFSFNSYTDVPDGKLNEIALDKPMLVGEFHYGALDAGLPSPSLFWVKDQKARGEAYERFVTHMAAHPNGVGAHYFAYNDQPLWGRYDGENYQFGMVDICNRAYQPFVAGIRRTNERIYRVMTGQEPPLSGETVRITMDG